MITCASCIGIYVDPLAFVSGWINLLGPEAVPGIFNKCRRLHKVSRNGLYKWIVLRMYPSTFYRPPIAKNPRCLGSSGSWQISCAAGQYWGQEITLCIYWYAGHQSGSCPNRISACALTLPYDSRCKILPQCSITAGVGGRAILFCPPQRFLTETQHFPGANMWSISVVEPTINALPSTWYAVALLISDSAIIETKWIAGIVTGI